MSILEIRQEHDAETGVEVIAPQGEIDISNLPILDQVLADVLERRPQRLVVDLTGLDYVDSGGVSSLLRAGHRLSRQGGQLFLAGGSRFVRRLVQMTGISSIFPYHDTLTAALGWTSGSGAPSGSLASPAPEDEAGQERLRSEVDAGSSGATLSAPRRTP